jgi:hypothetical protein
MPWSRRGLPLPASKVWPAVLAGAACLFLLVAFDQVVRGAVVRSELRRQAEAQHAEATWRCKALRGSGASQTCLVQLTRESGRAP